MSKIITQFHSSSPSSLNRQKGTTAQILVLFLVALIFTALVAVFIGYQFGHRQGMNSAQKLMTDHNVSADSSMLVEQNTQLQSQMDAITKERDITLGNLERLNAEQQLLKTKNLQLQQVNDLLKSSVAEQGGVALKIIGAEITSLPENTFEYRFDVAMIDVSGVAVRMVPRLTLLNATSMVSIPLEPSSYEIDGVANIRGRFVMPEGFVPKQMKVELSAGGQKIQQLYNWQVGRVITDAPTSLLDAGSTDDRPIVNR